MNKELTKEQLDKLEIGLKENPFVAYLGVKVIEVKPGYLKAEMPLKKEHKQHTNVIHGGIIASFADTISGIAAFTQVEENKNVLTAELKVSFLRARWGDKIVGIAKVIKPGRNIHFCETEIYCNGDLISKTSGTFCVVDIPK